MVPRCIAQPKGDLRAGALMGFRDFEKDRISQDAFIFPGHIEREIGIGPRKARRP